MPQWENSLITRKETHLIVTNMNYKLKSSHTENTLVFNMEIRQIGHKHTRDPEFNICTGMTGMPVESDVCNIPKWEGDMERSTRSHSKR